MIYVGSEWGGETSVTGARDEKGKIKAIPCKCALAVLNRYKADDNVPGEAVTYDL